MGLDNIDSSSELEGVELDLALSPDGCCGLAGAVLGSRDNVVSVVWGGVQVGSDCGNGISVEFAELRLSERRET